MGAVLTIIEFISTSKKDSTFDTTSAINSIRDTIAANNASIESSAPLNTVYSLDTSKINGTCIK